MNNSWFGAAIAALCLSWAGSATAQISTVTVTGGRVQGVSADGVTSFKGIPFAAPPVGDLRWREPQPVQSWRGVKQADHFAPGCMQASNVLAMFGEPSAMSEDCLYLNVWTPARSARARLPVMVWIYGGSDLVGMTSQPAYEGTHLARKGVVVVSLAYRVGVFGFLATPGLSAESPGHVSGNYGLLDMVAGLKWVRENILQFGGDPARVTVFGESAGGFAISQLTVSPLARGLFQRAVAESGASFSLLSRGDSENPPAVEAAGQRFLDKLGAKDVKAARALDAQVILTAQGPALPTGGGGFSPKRVNDPAFPTDLYRRYQAGRFSDTPVLLGSNSDEGSLFVPAHTEPAKLEAQVRAMFGPLAKRVLAAYPHATEAESSQAEADIDRDLGFAWPAWTWARLQSEHGKGRAYLYYFDRHAPQYPPQGSPHGAEIGYVFDNLGQIIPGDPRQTWPAAADDPALAALISAYWVNFARTGDPNGPGLPNWPAFDAATQQVMVFDDHPSARPLPNREKLDALDAFFHSKQ